MRWLGDYPINPSPYQHTMRITQITDLHVGEPGETAYGADMRANFLKILAETKKLNPNYLVITGDLCYDTGVRSIYAWMKIQLDALQIPYDVIAGNHDEPRLLAEVFGRQADLHDTELYFAKNINDTPILFLDTTVGMMSEQQLTWLQQCLQSQYQAVTIFMHHPPLYASMPWMDARYPLLNRDAVQQILFAHPYPITVFCGHYHIDKTVQQRNVTMHITPSCFFQIDQHSEDFKIDHLSIALREIEIDGEALRHSVFYF